jgi:hypothetical protein
VPIRGDSKREIDLERFCRAFELELESIAGCPAQTLTRASGIDRHAIDCANAITGTYTGTHGRPGIQCGDQRRRVIASADD